MAENKSAFGRTASKVRTLLAMQAYFLTINKHPEGRPPTITRKELTTWEYHHVVMSVDRQRRNNVNQTKALADGTLVLTPAADGQPLTYPQWLLNKVPGEDCPFHVPGARGVSAVPWHWIEEQAAEAKIKAAESALAVAAAKAAKAAAAAATPVAAVTPVVTTPVAPVETPSEAPVEVPVTAENPVNETRKQRREREAREKAAQIEAAANESRAIADQTPEEREASENGPVN